MILQKTINAMNSDKYDEICNKFRLEHDVRFSQSHINMIQVEGRGMQPMFTKVLLYETTQERKPETSEEEIVIDLEE